MMRGRVGSCFFRAVLLALVVSAVDAQVGDLRPRYGIPEDWTHHHIVFPIDFLRQHPEIASREPRAIHEIYRRWARPTYVGVGLSPDSNKAAKGDWNVFLGVGTLAAGTSPAKYQVDPTAPPSCSDYVVFGINARGVTGTGTNGQATIVAFNKLYANNLTGQCPGGPTFLFAYNSSTITNGRIRTSPVLSLDGKKIAFVESSATGSAVHILQFGTTGNNGGNPAGVLSPAVPGTGNNAVMTTIAYTTANNTHSSPWVDYPSDTMYLAADDGKLYKITGVFKGTPTLISGGGWPITIPGAAQVSGAVFDSTTGRVFIGDSHGVLHSVNVVTPGPVSNLAVGNSASFSPAIYDAPIVDAYGSVFATSPNDGTSAVVVQATAGSLTQQARVRIGAGSTTGTALNMFDGDFDNNYYNSQNSGHMLVCGTAAGTDAPFRYTLGFTGGILQADPFPVQISTSTTARCSPITEFFNPNIGAGGTDFFFWGVSNTCVGATGCIMSLANGVTVNTAAETGGTSAVIIDNDNTTAGMQTSNLYFATQGSRLAIKVSQSGLN